MTTRPPYGLCLPCKLDHVRDGDTVVINLPGSGREWAIRLINCWCPELHQPGGKEAKAFAKTLLEDAEDLAIYIPAPTHVANLLKNLTFDRIPGRVFLDRYTSLGEELIKARHATRDKPG